jgi:outer membrane protein assembly factor BamB
MRLRTSHCRRRPALIVVLIAVAALVLSSCDWAQFRFGPDGTGFNPFESTIGASNVAALQPRWSEVSGIPSWESPPVVAGGVVYASTCGLQNPQGEGPCAYGSRLDAFDAATGSAKWSFAKGPNVFGTGYPPAPAVANGVVYDMSGSVLHAVDASTGLQRWAQSTGIGVNSSALVVADGAVYVASGDAVFAYNATTGALLWSSTVGDGGDEFPKVPAVANGLVYTTLDGQLSALDANTGKLRWSVPPTVYSGGSSPAVAKGVVYVDDGNTLFGFNATTGAQVWSAVAPSGWSWQGSPAVANGVVYLAANYFHSGELDAFNATTGAPVWSASTPGPDGISSSASSPAVANGVVYLGVDDGFLGVGQLDAFNATSGSSLWSRSDGGGAVDYSPVIANGVLYTSRYGFCPPLICTGDTGFIEAYGLPINGSAITVAPTFARDFGTVLDGRSTAARWFTVTNFGSTATPITATFTGADPSQFGINLYTCANAPLAAGASCTIKVGFAPTLPGVRTANLVVHGTAGGLASATLSGTGNALTIDPNAKDYGSVPIGTTSPATTFTVTNHSAISVTTSVATSFTVTADACDGATLAPGATCNIAVAYAPTDIETDSSTLTVTSTPGVATSATLTGTGTPFMSVPATKDYGTVPVGSSSAATFTMTNVTSQPAPTAVASVTGSGFSVTSDGCGALLSLAPGASCDVVVTFTPTVAGTTYNGELQLVCFGPIFDEATLVGKGG